MLAPTLLIVADLGSLKAYRIEPNPASRPPRLFLLRAFDLAVARGRLQDTLTDGAGRFPGGAGGNGGHMNGVADRGTIEMENDRRAVKELAEAITGIVRDGERWALAAPGHVNKSLIDHLDPDTRQKLVDSVPADLVKVEPGKLMEHFPSCAHYLQSA